MTSKEINEFVEKMVAEKIEFSLSADVIEEGDDEEQNYYWCNGGENSSYIIGSAINNSVLHMLDGGNDIDSIKKFIELIVDDAYKIYQMNHKENLLTDGVIHVRNINNLGVIMQQSREVKEYCDMLLERNRRTRRRRMLKIKARERAKNDAKNG